MATVSRSVTPASFQRLVRPLLGLPVSLVWQSFEWALFLELGRLRWEPNPLKPTRRFKLKKGSWKGQAGVMLDAGWRIEKEESILADFRSAPGVMKRAVRSLRGRKVEAIGVEGRLPEISIQLSGGFWVRSLTVAWEETQWALFLDQRPETSVWLASRGKGLLREVGF
jgi:hypothetical protein